MVSPLCVAWRLTIGSYYEIPETVKLCVPPQQSWGSPSFSCAEMVPFHLAYVYAYRDEADLAFEWLYKAATIGPQVLMAAVHPFLLKLHDDPRWLRFLESIGKSPDQLSGIEFNLTLSE